METDRGEADDVVAELRIVVIIVLDDRLGCLSRELYSQTGVQLFRAPDAKRDRSQAISSRHLIVWDQILIPTYNQHGGNVSSILCTAPRPARQHLRT